MPKEVPNAIKFRFLSLIAKHQLEARREVPHKQRPRRKSVSKRSHKVAVDSHEEPHNE